MRVVPVFTPTSLLTAWTPAPAGLALVALAVVPYAVWLRRARRLGVAWSWWRPALYLGLGVGTLAYAVCGPLAVYRTQVYWIGALQVGVLASLTPVGLALGDPVRLLRAASPDSGHWLLRLLGSRLARALMFPAVSTMLAVGTLLAVFYTPWFDRSVHSDAVAAVLYVVLLGSGLLFVLPLLVDELLPHWATPPVRAFLAFGDGLLDAIPGILVMTSSTLLTPHFPGFSTGVSGIDPALDQKLGGGALLAVAEAVGLPVIGAVFMEWVRSDEREAQVIDAQLEAEQRGRRDGADTGALGEPGLRRPQPSRPGGAEAEPDAHAEPASSGLWWETDPRLSGRFGPRD